MRELFKHVELHSNLVDISGCHGNLILSLQKSALLSDLTFVDFCFEKLCEICRVEFYGKLKTKTQNILKGGTFKSHRAN